MKAYSDDLMPRRSDYNEPCDIINDTFCDLYQKFKHNGLNEFEKDGKIFGYEGVLMIQELIEYFVSLEWYEECAVLRNLLSDLQNRNEFHRKQRENQ